MDAITPAHTHTHSTETHVWVSSMFKLLLGGKRLELLIHNPRGMGGWGEDEIASASCFVCSDPTWRRQQCAGGEAGTTAHRSLQRKRVLVLVEAAAAAQE